MDAKSLFEILIRENTDMLVAYLRAGVRDEHVVDDLYQETVLTAWNRLDDYDRDKPIGPWLRGIAGKMVLAHYRKSSRAALPIDDQALQWLNDRFEAIHSMRGDTFHEKLAGAGIRASENDRAYRVNNTTTDNSNDPKPHRVSTTVSSAGSTPTKAADSTQRNSPE